MNQKEGVFQVIVELFGTPTTGEAFKPTKEQREKIVDFVACRMHEGEIELSSEARVKYNSVQLLKTKYVPGLVTNWLNRDLRLNGGTPHQTKNPGSRAGRGDAVLKNLNLLKSKLTNPEHIANVDAEIEKRKAALAAEKAAKVEVDVEKIPEALRHLIAS